MLKLSRTIFYYGALRNIKDGKKEVMNSAGDNPGSAY
jgi:hypothetical protein